MKSSLEGPTPEIQLKSQTLQQNPREKEELSLHVISPTQLS